MVCPVLFGGADAAFALFNATVATESTAALAARVRSLYSSVKSKVLRSRNLPVLSASIERVFAAIRFATSVGLVIRTPLILIGVVGRYPLFLSRVNEIDDATN